MAVSRANNVSALLFMGGVAIFLTGLAEPQNVKRICVAVALCMPALFSSLRAYVRFKH